MDFQDNWYEEKRSAYLYHQIAAKESNPTHKKLFQELEAMADKQASIWEKKLKAKGIKPPPFVPDIKTRIVIKLIKYFNLKSLRLILSAMKVRGMSIYLNSDPSYSSGTFSAHHERKHKGISTAGNLRAAVFGINDGLISNMSLLLGVAGATVDQHFILLSGIAGMLAGASSMAAGEYVSVRSQREFYEYQINLERSELEQYPEEEAAELAAIYRARGLPKADSERLAQAMLNNPTKALDTLAREELGLNPMDLGSPWGAAISSFFSFMTGAIIPLIPFFFGVYRWNFLISIVLTGVTLFSVGSLLSFFNNRSALLSGSRMLLIGAAAGIFTHAVGILAGHSIH